MFTYFSLTNLAQAAERTRNACIPTEGSCKRCRRRSAPHPPHQSPTPTLTRSRRVVAVVGAMPTPNPNQPAQAKQQAPAKPQAQSGKNKKAPTPAQANKNLKRQNYCCKSCGSPLERWSKGDEAAAGNGPYKSCERSQGACCFFSPGSKSRSRMLKATRAYSKKGFRNDEDICGQQK